MTKKQIVRLVIEVPENVEVHPVIVRKNVAGGAATLAGAGLTKNVKFDLTNSKSSEWLKDSNPSNTNCCCVRG